jgi:hypothetical protein
MRAFSAVPVAILLCAAAPAFADAQSSVQAAKKAEKRGEWRKALEAWKAAYSSDVNAEYLIGIGDAYAHLGNKDEAKKNYDAYLADPLALPANVEKVKTKIAELDNPMGGGLALPGGPGLALPGDAPPPLPGAAAPPPLPGLDLPGAAPVAAGNKKGKHKGPEPMALPGLDLPGALPAQVAEKKNEPPPLPGLDLPGMAPAPARKEEKKVASASPPPPGLDLPGLPLSPPPPPAKPPEKKESVAIATPPNKQIKTENKPLAAATPPRQEPKRVPTEAISETPAPRGQPQAEASGATKVVAYVAAGVALVSLGGGALAFTKAGSAHSDLTGKVHSGAEAQSLLETESKNKTLSFVGFAGGLVAAGIATALFVF